MKGKINRIESIRKPKHTNRLQGHDNTHGRHFVPLFFISRAIEQKIVKINGNSISITQFNLKLILFLIFNFGSNKFLLSEEGENVD